MSVSCKSFSLSFVLRAWAKCRLEFLNVLTPDFQLVDFLFLTRCKGTFKRAPCDKTLFISKAERKYLRDSKGTKNWWMAVGHCQSLSHIVAHCRTLSVIVSYRAKKVKIFLA